MIKSITGQHESTRIITSQHKSTRVRHESTRVNTSRTRINTSPTQMLIRAILRPATSLKKRLWHRCFLVNFVKFLRTHFLQNTSGRLLLTFVLSVQTLQSPSPSLRPPYIIDLAIKVGLSPSRKKFAIFASMKALKNDEKCFLFHLKRSFRSQDI